MNPWVRFSRSLHRRLVRAFPHEFQVLHGNELEQMGDDAIPFVWRQHGFFGLVRLLGSAAWGLAAEYGNELKLDIGYALRRLMASPGFTVLSVLSLALCIAMSSIFLMQMSIVTTPAPGIQNPEELVSPWPLVAYPYFEEYSERTESFSQAMAFLGPAPFTVGDEGDSAKRERVAGHLVTLDYFSTLGVTPARGRFFDQAEARRGVEPTVVVTDHYWQTSMNGRADAVGSTLRINGRDATVIGIAPAAFRGAFPSAPAELFLPVEVGPDLAPELRRDALHDLTAAQFRAVLRLAEGATREQAQAEIQVITQNLDQQQPKTDRPAEARIVELVNGGTTTLVQRQAARSMQIFSLVLFWMTLGTACANLAVLLLARANDRRKEIAVRLSSGASRSRLVRQQLTESVTLAMLGGAASLVFLRWIQRVSLQLQPASVPRFESTFDEGWAAALLVLGISALAGLLIGLAPALSSVRGEFLSALKQGTESRVKAYSRFGLRNQLVLFQISSSLMMMLLTGYIVLGYQRLNDLDPGFKSDNLYLSAIDPIRDGYSQSEAKDLLREMDRRLTDLPEVSATALSLDLPFSQMFIGASYGITITDNDGKDAVRKVARQRIGAGYFDLLGVPLLLGREFQTEEQLNSATDTEIPAILNQAAAKNLFRSGEALGQTIRDGNRILTVVGVVRDLKARLMMGSPVPTLFVPISEEDVSLVSASGITILQRSRTADTVLEATATEIASIDPNLTIFDMRSYDQDTAQLKELLRWSSILNGGLGVFGILLSIVALFSVTVHAVARRRKEIGVRVALGARGDQILRLVMREGLALVTVGALMGFGTAYGMTRIFSAIAESLARVFAVGADDPMFTVAAPLAWATLALLACWLPARRAMKINPAATLKAE